LRIRYRTETDVFGDAMVRIKRSSYPEFLTMNIKGLPDRLEGWLDLAATAREIWPNAREVDMSPADYDRWLKKNNKPANVQNFREFAEEHVSPAVPQWTDHDYDALDLA
jgi:hypothetical protein